MALGTRKLLAILASFALVLAACTGEAAPDTTEPATDPEPGETETAGTEAPTDECEIVENNGRLEPLASGFPSDPITIINIDEAGAPDGIYARQMQQAMTDISPVRINVSDRPDFGTYGTWEGLQFMRDDPDGSEGYIMAIQTVPGSTVDLLNTEVVRDLDVGVESTNILMATEFVPYAMTSRKDAPWGDSFEEMVAYAQANPGEVRYISRGPGSGLDIAFTAYQLAAAEQAGSPGDPQAGIPVETIIGGSHAEINAVLGAGEGDIAMTLVDVARQFHDDGRVEVILFSGEAPAPEPFTDVPTGQEVFGTDLLPRDPWGQNRALFTADNVPECHQAWLTRLVELATEDEEFREARLNVPGLTLQNLTRDEMNELAYDACGQIAVMLGPLDMIDPSVDPDEVCSP